MKRIVLISMMVFITALLCGSTAFATVNIVNESNGASAIFQRNAENDTYSIKVRLSVADPANISAMEANVTYDNTVFSEVSLTDANAGGSIWETSVVNANYQTVGNTTTVKYMKASTNGDAWAVSAGNTPTLYTLTFKVKNNAVTGDILIAFDPNYAKVQDAVTGNITGTLTNTTYTIVLDQTPPTSSVANGNVGGYYNAPVTVRLDTNETNDEATINYTTDDSIPNFTGGEHIRSSGNVVIPSGNNTLVITTLNYLARDWAQDRSPNEEATVKTQVYYVDTQLPTVNSVTHTAGPLAIGYWAYVTFNVADNSGLLIGDPSVTFTGGAASKVSGSGVGQFVYRKQVASGDNDGSNHIDITITGTDLAGNQATYPLPNAIALDFGAPSFTMSATPNPSAFLTWVTINVTASETLQSPGYPSVVVSPGNPAEHRSHSGVTSVFRYFVTGNGWTATVPWLGSGSYGDETLPAVTPIVPNAEATEISITTDIVLRITDNIVVATESIRVTIDGLLAMDNGVGLSPTWAATSVYVSIDGIVTITIDPSINLIPLKRVTVDVRVLDGANNELLYSYGFNTATANVHNISYTPTRHYNDIQSALDDAQPNQIIELDAATYDQGVTINWPNTTGLTLRGANGTTSTNVVITGGTIHRVFDLLYAGLTVNIHGITIKDGYVVGNGGAILVTRNVSLYLGNVVVSGNACTENSGTCYGGFLFASDLSTTIVADGCLFVGNRAYGQNAYGSVGSNGTWHIASSILENNGGEHSSGGGIGYHGVWNIRNSIVRNNKVKSMGAVSIMGTWNVHNSIFYGNTAFNNYNAKAGISFFGTWVVEGSTFYDNKADEAAVAYYGSWSATNTIFWDNKEYGIAHHDFYEVTSTLNNCSLATINYKYGSAGGVTSSIIIGNPLFASTVSTHPKYLQLLYGSPCIDSGTNNVSVTNDFRYMFRPMGYGYDMGAYEYEELFISEFTPVKSSTNNLSVTPDIMFRVRDYLHPSANVNLGITVNGTGYTGYTRVSDNSTAQSTDFYAVFDVADFPYGATTNVTINASCPVIALQDAYWFFVQDYFPPLITPETPTAGATHITVENTIVFRVTDNIAINIDKLNISVNGTLMVNNGINLDPQYSLTTGSITGGYRVTFNPSYTLLPLQTNTVDVYIEDTNGTQRTLTYTFWVVTSNIHNYDRTPSRHYMKIQSALDNAQENEHIDLDIGTYTEGATINWPAVSDLTLRGASGTTSLNVIISGGNIRRIFEINHPVTLSVEGLTIRDGYISGNIRGAAFFITGNATLMLNTIVATANLADKTSARGAVVGAVDNTARIFVTGSVFAGNKAAGGAVGFYGSWYVNDCSFFDNNTIFVWLGGSMGAAGAVGLEGDWTISHSRIYRNIGTMGTVGYHGKWLVDNCLIYENISTMNTGGAVFAYLSTTVNNTLIYDNTAESAVVAVFCTSNFINSTIYNNRALGMGSLVYGRSFQATNTLFWKNLENNIAWHEFYNAFVTLNNCLVSSVNYAVISTSSITNVLYSDPGFISEVSTNAGFLQLATGSIAINAGTSAGAPDKDMIGVSRPQGGAWDIGAYEWTGTFTSANFRAHNIDLDIYYPYIQPAFNGISADGQTIEVFQSTNTENMTWPSRNNVTLKGAADTNSTNVVLSGEGTHRILMIDKPVSLSIAGFTIKDGFISGNYDSGAAIWVTGNCTLNLTSLIITNNIATASSYAGFLGTISNPKTFITLKDSYIVNNSGRAGGFAIQGEWTIDNCIFWRNWSIDMGGVGSGGHWNVRNSRFSENGRNSTLGGIGYDSDWNVYNCVFNDNVSAWGGIAYAGKWVAVNSTFHNNRSAYGGIASSQMGGDFIGTNCIFANNKDNGVERWDFSQINVTLNNCIETTLNFSFGAINSSVNMIIGDPSFISSVSTNALYLQLATGSIAINAGNNSTGTTTDILGVTRPKGGKVDIGAYEWDGTFDGTNFRAHNIDTDAYYNRVQVALNDVDTAQRIELFAGVNTENMTWPSKNNVSLLGAAGTNSTNVILSGGSIDRVFMVSKPVSLNITGMTIRDGWVSGNNGGAIWITGNAVLNLNSVIVTNNIVTPSTSSLFGGAIYAVNNAVQISISDSLFAANHCVQGGVGYRGIWTVQNSTFKNNGIYGISSGAVGYGSVWNLTNCRFIDNVGHDGGMGTNVTVNAVECLFTGNRVSGGGGVLTGGNWNIDRSILKGNQAFAGGIASQGIVSVNNSIFYDNTATEGAVLYQSNWTIRSSTFHDNRAYAHGGIASDSSLSTTVDAVNSIFWANTSYGASAWDFYRTRLILTNCMVGTINYFDLCSVTTSDLIIADPQFQTEVSQDSKYLRLKGTSTAINIGSTDGVSPQDILGSPRGIYGGYDLGAYEYDNIYFSDYSPARSSTANLISPQISIRVRDYRHVSADMLVTINVNDTPHTDWTVGTDNSGATTDMYIILDVSGLAFGSTINVTANGQCPSTNMMSDVYWFITDIPPYITPVDPTNGQTGVMPWAVVAFDITDNISVATPSLMVTFNRALGTELAVENGDAAVTYDVSYDPITQGYRVSINHDLRFSIAEWVTVNILVADNNGYPTTLSYVFQIITDATGPSAPINVKAIASPNVRVELSWQHPVPGDVYIFRVYRVQSTTPAGVGTLIATTDAAVTTFNDTTMSTPNSYYYYVTAEDIYWNEGDVSNYAGAPYLNMVSRNYLIEAPSGYSGQNNDLVPGAKVTYTTYLNNIGYSPANEVMFTDWIPAHTTYVSGSVLCSDTATINYQHTPGGAFDDSQDNVIQVRWQMQNMLVPFTQERTATFSVTVD